MSVVLPDWMPAPTTDRLALLTFVRSVVTDHEEHWDQSSFWNYRPNCGTTGCVAGWAAFAAGARPVKNMGHPVLSGIWMIYQGEQVSVDALATTLLGLDNDQSTWLFDPDRTKAEVLAYLDVLIARETHEGLGAAWDAFTALDLNLPVEEWL